MNGKWLLGIAALVGVAVFAFVPAGKHLALGWLYFPLRVLPRVSADPAAVVLGLLSLAGFVVGLHFAIRQLITRESAASGPRSWPWRATVALSMIVLLLFVSGTAMVGATHQVVWLLSGRSSAATDEAEGVSGVADAIRLSPARMEASSRLKMITLGVQNFHDTFQDLPPGGTMTAEGELLHGWAMYVAPFTTFYAEGIDFSRPWNQPPNDKYYKCNLSLFVNPAIRGPYFDQQGYGYAHVSGNVHVLPIRTVDRAEFRKGQESEVPMRQLRETKQSSDMTQITDGASNTLLFGTVTKRFKPWGHPANVRDPAQGIDLSPDGFGGPPGWQGAVFSFCDGHTQLISRKVDPRVLQQLATPAGEETLPGNY